MRLGRPSAALVLGSLAGSFATLVFMPTALPLVWQIIGAEERFGLRHSEATAYAVQSQLRSGTPPGDLLAEGVTVDALVITRPNTEPVSMGTPLPADMIEEACRVGEHGTVVQTQRRLWAVTCVEQERAVVVAAVRLDPAAPAQRILALVLLLGLLVGIITALGVLRVLRPLSDISSALSRVGSGERGVRIPKSGLVELDEISDRLNATARSVEDREDAILGRIEVVQEMARIVAHEVRNPLQSLELLTSLIASEDDSTERHDIARSIHTEIRTLDQVVRRLLRESAASGSLRLQISAQPIAPLVEQVLALRRPQANNQSVRLNSGPLSWGVVPIDQALVKRAIENLVLNALQAVPMRTGEVLVSVIEDPEWMIIVVDDNGPGIPKEMQQLVFEANVTSKVDGTGIGLALVKGVVEAHSGYIVYGQSPLGGARFEARIPRERSEEGAHSAEPDQTARAGGG